jgi:hypothetical protein
MKGDIRREKSIRGRTTQRLTPSGAASAADFGASSPKTMCRNVMTRNAIVTAAAVWVAPEGTLKGERGEQVVQQRSQGRFTDPAERERGERDTELGARDVAVQVRERLLNGLRARVTLCGHLVDLTAACADQRELSCDEEPVREDEKEDSCQAEGGRASGECLSVFHDNP